MDITRLKNAFNTYFNSILKNALGYGETFSININDREITLTSTGNSQLIQRLKSDDTLLDKISQQLLTAFRDNNPDIEYVELEIVNDKQFIIKYGFNVYSIKDFNIIAQFAKELDSKNINDLCVSNPVFAEVCKNPQFWAKMLTDKFGSFPILLLADQMPRSIDYKRLYLDVLKYLETDNKHEFSLENNPLNDVDTISILYMMGKKMFNLKDSRDYEVLFKSEHIYNYRIYKIFRYAYNFTTSTLIDIISNIIYKLSKTINNSESDNLYNLLKAVLEDLLKQTNPTRVFRETSTLLMLNIRRSIEENRNFLLSDKIIDLLQQIATPGYNLRDYIESTKMREQNM